LNSTLKRLRTDYLKSLRAGGKQKALFERNLFITNRRRKRYWEWKVPFTVEHSELIEQLIHERCTAQTAIQKLKTENANLKKSLSQSAVHILAKKLLGTAKLARKKFHTASRMHQWRLKQNLLARCEAKLSFLKSYGLKPSSVHLHSSPSKTCNLTFAIDNGCTCTPNREKCDKIATEKKLDETLYAIDRFNIPESAYHQLALNNKSLPRIHSIRKRKRELDAEINLKQSTEGGIEIVYQNFDEKLSERVHVLSKCGKLQSPSVRVKLNGDGTPVGRNINLVDICFTVLEESVCTSSHGNYPVILYKGKENYENLKTALGCILNSAETCTSIDVAGTSYVV
jgi:hypothetical protein